MKISLRLTFLYFLALASVSLTFSESVSAAITVSSARWSSGRLTVAGTSTGRQTVTLSNTVTGQTIGQTTASRSGSWSYSKSLSSSQVPCRVRARTSTDGSVDSPVTSAPSNCVGASKVDQSPLIVSANPTSITSGGTSASLSTSGGSTNGSVTYATTTLAGSVNCSINGSTLTANGGDGSCSITATMAGNTNYNAVTSAAITVAVIKQAQSALTISANPTSITSGDAGTTLNTQGGNGSGMNTYTASNSGNVVCTVSGNILTATGSGSCLVTATKAADTNYNAITSEAITITVTKADQSALTISATPTSITSGGPGSTFNTEGGNGSGSVTYAANGTGNSVCTVNGNTLTATGSGTCAVTATKAADTNYNAITSAAITITVTKAEQTALTVTANPTSITSGDIGSTLSTTGGNGEGSVSYSSTTASGSVSCRISSNTLTATGGVGSCAVTATKAADINYNAVTSTAITVTVTSATQSALIVSATPTSITSGGTGSTLSTTGGNGTGAVTYAAIGSGNSVCTVNGSTLTATGSGTCAVTATKAADNNYNAITSAAIVVTVKAQTSTSPVSISSTSTDSLAPVEGVVSELPSSPVGINGTHSILAVNDLGMHCVDNDTRVVNILPPFQVLLGQVIQKGSKPILNPAGVELFYSSASNAKDPILGKTNVLNGLRTDGTTFKTNFWWNVDHGGYDAFYPVGLTLSTSGLMAPDKGLPVPNTEKLYLEGQGLEISQQLSPGAESPYANNDPQKVNERYTNKPFFKDFPFGYVADKVNWHEAAGIPMAPFDDSGRQNPYPLIRVQAKQSGNDTAIASVDAVLPVSSESSCVNCHASTQDVAASGAGRRTLLPVTALINAGLPVASSANDPDPTLPASVKLEYGTDINILRLHDLKHGKDYVKTTGTGATEHVATECDIVNNKPNGNDNCLTYQALVAEKPVVCQTCHYTPALDLLQVGPKNENGRIQLVNKTNSNVMHSHHGSLKDENGNPLFPLIPQALQSATDGSITNQPARAQALEENCYQCHPGKDTKCLRGAMFNGGMLCSDCHGDMTQVGNDFSRDVSKAKPAAFDLHGNFYTDASQPRVPWANEPGCGSCHTGDANSNFAAKAGVLKNLKDHNGVTDNIRLRQAFLTGDAKATPIVPTNKRFAEPVVPATSAATGEPNPGAGNPQLFRVSTGHSGVMCEGCHGPTHAEWPVADNNANDNQTAIQLQGHAGFINECTACHTPGSLSASTQNGPHGMHVVNDSRFWSEAHKDMAKRENGKTGRGTCGSCHGSDHLGTVLSRVPVDRTFRVEGTNRTVKAGQPVSCSLCHSVSKSFGQ